ncbi:MAG: fused MFS/spermidine synthase [Alphaproteobacteria bacterium]|nr:fused MFS/spermidine synthase [Alphaproteobacteria bacterium]
MTKKLRLWLVFLIFLNGFVSMSLELVVMRQLSFFVGSAAVITSIIMGCFMGFMSLGYFMGTRGNIGASRARRILAISFLIISTLAILAGSFPLVSKYFEWMYAAGVRAGFIQTFIFSFAVLSVGPFLFGYNTTLLSRMLHKYNTNYAGNIMAWDTIGSVLASIATTLVLMPFIGVNHTIMLVVALGLMGAVICRRRWWIWVAAAIILAAATAINSDAVQRKYFGILVNNANSTISVTDAGALKILYMNGLPMSVYYPQHQLGAEYINYINDNFIYNMPRDKVRKILVLGAGGFTAGLKDTFNEYTFVDIESTLKEISEKEFLKQKLTPNKKFVVRDASQYLKNKNEEYDLIILDVYSNSYQIPENLITAEFMSRIKSRVAPNGIIIMNMVTSASFDDAYTRVFDNTFHRVFPYNTQRQVIGYANPWTHDQISNVMYIYYNRENDGRIYTINKTPVIYDRY